MYQKQVNMEIQIFICHHSEIFTQEWPLGWEKTNKLVTDERTLHYFEKSYNANFFQENEYIMSHQKRITCFSRNDSIWKNNLESNQLTFKLLCTNECFAKWPFYIILVSNSRSMRGICAEKQLGSPHGKLTTYKLENENLPIWFLTFIRWGRVNWKGEIINLAGWRARESSLRLTSSSHPEGN